MNKDDWLIRVPCLGDARAARRASEGRSAWAGRWVWMLCLAGIPSVASAQDGSLLRGDGTLRSESTLPAAARQRIPGPISGVQRASGMRRTNAQRLPPSNDWYPQDAQAYRPDSGGAPPSADWPNSAATDPRSADGTNYGSSRTAPVYPPAYGYPNEPSNVTLDDASWTYQPPPPVRTFQVNDIVTIRVDEISRLRAEGNSESRRNTIYDALLRNWIQFDGWDTIKPAQQDDGDPRVQGSTNQLFRADSFLESRQSLTFNIAARVVDIRPNGDLVLEARKTVVYNDNVWETSLSGICRAVDIAVDNVVLSRDLLDLQINTRERGHLRDGYKRGWFTRWLTNLNPF